MNKMYLEYKARNIEQHRDFFKYIGTISLAVLGLSSFILERSKYVSYTISSLVLYAFIIFFIVLYLRELLDRENRGLTEEQRKYNLYSDEALTTVDKYINNEKFNLEDLENFWKEIKDSNNARELDIEIKKLREENKKENKDLDYSGEFIISVILTAFLLMILGAIGRSVSAYQLISAVVIILFASFSNPTIRILKIINIIVNFVKDSIYKIRQYFVVAGLRYKKSDITDVEK